MTQRERVLAALKARPMTTPEVAGLLGRSRNCAHSVLRKARLAGLVHVCDRTAPVPSRPGRGRAVWALGPGIGYPDAGEQILSIMSGGEAVSSSDLADELLADRNVVVAALRRMEARGKVVRVSAGRKGQTSIWRAAA